MRPGRSSCSRPIAWACDCTSEILHSQPLRGRIQLDLGTGTRDRDRSRDGHGRESLQPRSLPSFLFPAHGEEASLANAVVVRKLTLGTSSAGPPSIVYRYHRQAIRFSLALHVRYTVAYRFSSSRLHPSSSRSSVFSSHDPFTITPIISSLHLRIPRCSFVSFLMAIRKTTTASLVLYIGLSILSPLVTGAPSAGFQQSEEIEALFKRQNGAGTNGGGHSLIYR